ncbi:hypothetical protein BXZ70DRAFT_940037 [Cristinia sonorae]|uniref:Uncharacterized protein n=1 Tax=Cristinia sonorae TaxID=1940300 RepID=A0A8K0UPR3_9AGAR|nr:hypothetical protein BXZ70DRAFT_940037 [Cristinia sonorae]
MLPCCLPNLWSAGGRHILFATYSSGTRAAHVMSSRAPPIVTQLTSLDRPCDLKNSAVRYPDVTLLPSATLDPTTTCDTGGPSCTPSSPPRLDIEPEPLTISFYNKAAPSLPPASRVAVTKRHPRPAPPTEESTLTHVLRTLCAFLSHQNITSSSPITISLSELKYKYRFLKSAKGSRQFISANSDVLLDILGALLTGHKNPFGQHLDVITARTLVYMDSGKDILAKLVVRVVADRKRCGFDLRQSDRYWLMHAYLAELEAGLVASGPLQDNSRTPEDALALARFQYRSLQAMSNPTIHSSYITVLLEMAHSNRLVPKLSEKCWKEALAHICTLLESDKQFHPSLWDLLWQVMLKPTGEVTAHHTHRLLERLRQRVDSFVLQTRVSSSNAETHVVDVRRLASSLAYSLLEPRNRAAGQFEWADRVSVAAITDPPPIHAFHNLVLLSLTQAPRPLFLSHQPMLAVPAPSPVSYEEVEWRVVCILASLERELNDDGPRHCSTLNAETATRVLSLVRSVWNTWTSSCRDRHRMQMEVVPTAIISSFLHLVGRLRNSELLADIYQECNKLCLFSVETLSSSHLVRSLYTDYIVASILCAGPQRMDYTMHLVARPLHKLPTKFRTTIWDGVVTQYSWSEETATLALWLFRSLHLYDVKFSPASVHAVAFGLARTGRLDAAMEFINPPTTNLTPTQQLSIFLAISKVVARNERDSNSKLVLNRHLATGLIQCMSRSLGSGTTPLEWRAHLEGTLLAASRASSAADATPIALMLMSGRPSGEQFFSPSFWTSLLRTLLDQRRFHVAYRVHSALLKDYDHLYTSNVFLKWRHMLYRRYRLQNAFALAALVSAAHPSKERSVLSHIRRGGRRTSLNPRVAVHTLQLPKILLGMDRLEVGTCVQVMRMMLKAGRLSAAKRLHREIHVRMQEQEASGINQSFTAAQVHTILGNLILDSSSLYHTRSADNLVGRTRAILHELRSENGFVPDRVTLNVLLKATLVQKRKGGMDQEAVRKLVDRVVRHGGYPTFGLVKEGEVPFGTLSPLVEGGSGSTAASASASGTDVDADADVPGQVDQRISWRRHARPLFKMFIKALYIRGDKVGARRMLRILKAGEGTYKMEMEMKGREEVRARLEGRQVLRGPKM